MDTLMRENFLFLIFFLSFAVFLWQPALASSAKSPNAYAQKTRKLSEGFPLSTVV